MKNKKDNRKVLKNVRIEANGNCAFIDGKYDPTNNTLKVYKYHGDITIKDEAIQNYAIDNHIDKVIFV